jgi:ESCRT-II complex subunit VPS22
VFILIVVVLRLLARSHLLWTAHKGFWSEVLGVGDFYYELAVQMIDVCLSTRAHNGGLIAVEDMLKRLKDKRGRFSQPISVYDPLCA